MLDNANQNLDKNELTSGETENNVESSKQETVAQTTEEETAKDVEVVQEATELKEENKAKVIDKNKEAVDEIEKSVAENSENNDAKENAQEEVEAVNYSKFSLEELVASLKKIISDNPVQKIKVQVEEVKSAFNKKFGAFVAEKKKAFLAEGGNSIDFQFSLPVKEEYNSLLSEYKKKRDAYYIEIDKQLNSNLEKRVKVIEDLKELIDEADATTMYKKFKDIQDSWRSIGPVPKTYYNDTWKIYHHHVERFYDLLNLSNDFRDLEFKNNLEQKLQIIEKAKALANEADVNFASKELQDLHKIWKEDIGPVASEMREEIWHKFSEATKIIHDKRHDYFKEMRSKYQQITEKKLEVIEAINAYDTSNNKNHSDWQKSINDIEALRKQYFNAGKLPYTKSEEVWQKFKKATKKFNSAKNVFYKEEKNWQQENLKNKIALIEIAESLKESEDWENATNTLKKVQADWKDIGHVPRKFSDDIWKRFKAACNHYFDRLHQKKNNVSKEEQANVTVKKEFLENLKETKLATKEAILSTIKDWRALGALPRNMRHLEGKFNKQIDKMFETLSLDKAEISMLKFTTVVDGYVADNDQRKLESEQFFIRKKIDEANKEIQQLENNLGFFSNAKPNNPLVMNVKNQVAKFKEDVLIWEQKLNYLKNLDN
tara:strand:+ start:418 stop:2394 length:1977 start_codon:yes stop_codon:yes gene_type:complete